MPRADSLRRNADRDLDDVDEYIRHRQLEGARRSGSARRSDQDGRTDSQSHRSLATTPRATTPRATTPRATTSRATAPRATTPRATARNSSERARARDLLGADLGTDFIWSDVASSKSAAPSSDALAPAWDDAADVPDVTSENIIGVSPDLSPPSRALAVVPDAFGSVTPTRRTIVITGRGSERYVAPRRGYDANLRRHERAGFKPDRVAMWAVLLGLALLLGAVTSSHAATFHAAFHVAH